MNRFRFLSLAGCLCMAAAALAEEPSHERDAHGTTGVPHVAYPLWDGKESVAQYARRVNLQLWGDPPGRPAIQRIALQETQTLDLGGGVTLELVLIPAGKFIMGTPEPQPVDEEAFRKKIVTGRGVLAAGGGILLVLIGFAILRAIRERRRFQYSLRRFMGMAFAASLCVLGGMHWWFSAKVLAQAQAEYKAALARYQSSYDWEKPAHEVTLRAPFCLGKFPVTQEQYMQVMGTNPSHFKGAGLPVEMVSWDDAEEFCKKVCESPLSPVGRGVGGEGDTKRTPSPGAKAGPVPARPDPSPHGGEGKWVVRLPTEAEWEFACRAGTVTTYYSGDTEADLGRAAWYSANSKATTHPVGQKEPNGWGLYDMHGNVWQWCADWYKEYAAGAATDPQGPGEGAARVLRGGSWCGDAGGCRSAHRGAGYPDDRYFSVVGFRVVAAPRTP